MLPLTTVQLRRLSRFEEQGVFQVLHVGLEEPVTHQVRTQVAAHGEIRAAGTRYGSQEQDQEKRRVRSPWKSGEREKRRGLNQIPQKLR